MTSHVSGTPAGRTHRTAESGFATGWTLVAAVMMVVGGALAVFEGIAAIAEDDIFVATDTYVYQFDLTSWGWIHLALGIVVILAGLALFRESLWARAVGVLLAGLSLVANFMWLPYAPVWAVVLIVIDVFIIFALCAPRRNVMD